MIAMKDHQSTSLHNLSLVKRELIDSVFHDQYKNLPIYYYWYMGAPLIGFSNYRMFSRFRTDMNLFEYIDVKGVVKNMISDGVFMDGRYNNMILLVHGWHGVQSSEGLFKQVLRHTQKMIPNSAVIFVKWENQGANDVELGNAAYSSIRINLVNLLTELPNNTRLHCIGHSLGGHACGAICRQYRSIKNKNCTRILGLDPASVMFKHNSPYPDIVNRRLNKDDADYVALLMTNRNLMGLHDMIGHEYIMVFPKYSGYFHEGCPTIGKWHGRVCTTSYFNYTWCENYDVGTMFNSYIIPHTSDSCSHMMAPIQFVKLLDVWNQPVVASVSDGATVLSPSVWNSYSISLDKRYAMSNITHWASFSVDENSLHPLEVVIFILDKDSVIPSVYGSTFDYCTVFNSYKHCLYFVKGDLMNTKSSIKILNKHGNIYIGRIRKGEGIFSLDWEKFNFKKSSFFGVSSFREAVLQCNGGNCYQTQSISYPSLRNMLNVNGKVLERCPVEDTIDLQDLVFSSKEAFYCDVRKECLVPDYVTKTKLSNTRVNVIKMWDSFDQSWHILYYYGIQCSSYVAKAMVNSNVSIVFNYGGFKTLHFVFDYDKISVGMFVNQSDPSTTMSIITNSYVVDSMSDSFDSNYNNINHSVSSNKIWVILIISFSILSIIISLIVYFKFKRQKYDLCPENI